MQLLKHLPKSLEGRYPPEKNEEGEEEVAKVVATMDNAVFSGSQTGLVETNFTE